MLQDVCKQYKIARAVKKLKEANHEIQQSTSQCTAKNNNVLKENNSRITRSQLNHLSIKPRNESEHNKCIICGYYSHKGEKQTFRISEKERADKFFQITRFFQDDVFVQCSDLENSSDIFASDIYCHKNCIKLYLKKYEIVVNAHSSQESRLAEHSDKDSESNEIVTHKSSAIAHVINSFIPRVRKGEVFTLTNVRDQANEFSKSTLNILNINIKNYLIDNYGETIEFSVPSDRKKATLFYDSKISLADVLTNLQPKNILKKSAKMIKDALNTLDFNLEDKFLDVYNLRSSWEKFEIPENLLIFLTELYALRKRAKKESVQSELSENKILKMKALCQIMFYILKNGKVKTPLHVLIAQTIHITYKSKDLIECFNRLGLSIWLLYKGSTFSRKKSFYSLSPYRSIIT